MEKLDIPVLILIFFVIIEVYLENKLYLLTEDTNLK